MELLQLKYFQVIARTQNISAAANELHIAQPSLSQILKRLECEIGVPLFDRVGRRIVLNEYGAIFLKYANEVFASLDNASLEISSVRGTDAKSVTLSVLAASMLLPELYLSIRRADPELLLHIRQDNREHSPEKDELILSCDLEPPADTGSCSILLREEILLALPAGHRLLEQPSVRLADLSEEAFLELSPDSSLSRVLSHYFAVHRYAPNVTAYIDNPDLMRKLLCARAGIAFIPAVTWQGFSSRGVALRRVDELSMQRYLLLSWKPDTFLTPSVRLCRDAVLAYFTRYSRQDR